MYHLWRMDNGSWTYLGALGQSAIERNLRAGHTNAQFFAMAA